jgi:hypothetical protein
VRHVLKKRLLVSVWVLWLGIFPVRAAITESAYRYLSPLPGAEYTSPQTRFVLVRFQNIAPAAVTNLSGFIQVTGEQSGAHAGQTRIASDGRTVIYQMTSDFATNETVTVSLTPEVPPAAGGPVPQYQYQFVISGHFAGGRFAARRVSAPATPLTKGTVLPALRTDLRATNGLAGIMPNGVSVPSDFPWIKVSVNDHPDPSPIFIDAYGGIGNHYNVIFDNSGSPIWYQRFAYDPCDMKVQANGVLTMTTLADDGYHFSGYDTHYRLITNYFALNGYVPDSHELQVLADGTCLLIGQRAETVDMSRYVVDGNTAAVVTETVIQEFTAAGELVFQWRAWDHLDVVDEQEFIDLHGNAFDFPHLNAIDIDLDGHILLSSRNTSEVCKINRDTGEFIWRLGGAHNQFTFVNDPLDGPRNQHTIRVVATNHYTLFDNGNLHQPPMSRGVEYALDLTNMTAILVWQYPNPATSNYFAFYMGNVQRLTNGNTLINWAVGNLPKLTEVRPDGTKAYEMNWIGQRDTYRVWRCPWQGSALQPYLIIEPYPDNLTLIFNQFGDTNVAFYRIYGGPMPQPTNLVATSGATLKQLTELQNGVTYYFRVTAVNRQGLEGQFSNEEIATANFIKPGHNMIPNGDFTQGTDLWTLATGGSGIATWGVTNGAAAIRLINSGIAVANVQLNQAGMKLIQGSQYVLAFDAWAAKPRSMEVRVLMNQSPSTSYTVATPALTVLKQHFAYPFFMQNETDLNARLAFDLGAYSGDVYLDNISLFEVCPGDCNLDGRVDLLDLKLLIQDWLKQPGSLGTDLNSDGIVNFSDFSSFGEYWSGGSP